MTDAAILRNVVTPSSLVRPKTAMAEEGNIETFRNDSSLGEESRRADMEMIDNLQSETSIRLWFTRLQLARHSRAAVLS